MINLPHIGERLRAQRVAGKITVDTAAKAAGISRALLYRYEAGAIVKLDVLQRLASLYGTSLPALLGADQEYFTNSVVFFDRLERLEADATRITTVFGPLAYVLTGDDYDEILIRSLAAIDGQSDGLTANEASRLRRVLRKRKSNLVERKPNLINIVPLHEVADFLRQDSVAADIRAGERSALRHLARKEMQRLSALLANPPLGVQIGLTRKPLPTSGFQLLTLQDRTLLVTSPFRLGEPLNLRYGVATVSGDDQAVRQHENLVSRLWRDVLTGQKAAAAIEDLLAARG